MHPKDLLQALPLITVRLDSHTRIATGVLYPPYFVCVYRLGRTQIRVISLAGQQHGGRLEADSCYHSSAPNRPKK